MTQHIINRSLVPPGGFRAKCLHCSMWIKAPTYPDMGLFVADHNRANAHEPWDWETQLCELLPGGSCAFEDGSIAQGHDCRMNADGLRAGMEAMSSVIWSMAVGRDVFVDQGEAEHRAAICAGCPKNVTVEGCGSCSAMTVAKAMIGKLKGGRSTTRDGELLSCCVCLCDLSTIVHFKGGYLIKGFTDSQRKITEQLAPHCWKLSLTNEE